MADKKISALTGASTPLAGTEVLPIVQSGATVKVAVSDLTAGRAISATSVTASTGNFVAGTSGKGVTDSTGANTLSFTSTDTTANKNFNAANFRTITNSATIPGSSTATILTLSSSITGTYYITADFGGQGNAIYSGMLIVVANAGSFRIVTNGSGTSSALTLSGANVQILNPLGVALTAYAAAMFVGY
jgi:hypothetical protein